MKEVLFTMLQNQKVPDLLLIKSDRPHQILDETKKWLQTHLTGQTLDHEDLLLIQLIEGKSQYTIEQIDSITTFLVYPPRQLERKLIVIENLNQLSNIHLNKLLKVLEEAWVPRSFLIFSPLGQNPLQTMTSRAQTLRVNYNQTSDFNPLDVPLTSLHDFTQFLKENPQTEELIISSISKKSLNEKSSFNFIEQLQSLYQLKREDELFNNSAVYRQQKLYQLIKHQRPNNDRTNS